MSILAHLVEVLLPSGGHVVQLIEAFFDESGSDKGSPVLCVGGFIVEKEACKRLDESWRKMLEKFALPYFRMSACANGADPFDKLPMPQRIEAETEAIGIIRREVILGIAVTVEPSRYERIVPSIPELGSAYSFCAHTCLTAVKVWAKETGYAGDIAYFFESGHPSQSEANRIMDNIFKIPELRQQHRYVAHSFVDKTKVLPVQAADLIAWHWQKDHKRRMLGAKPTPRADTRALFDESSTNGKPTYRVLHWEEFMLHDMVERHLRRNFPLTYVRH